MSREDRDKLDALIDAAEGRPPRDPSKPRIDQAIGIPNGILGLMWQSGGVDNAGSPIVITVGRGNKLRINGRGKDRAFIMAVLEKLVEDAEVYDEP